MSRAPALIVAFALSILLITGVRSETEQDSSILPNWIGSLLPILGNNTILDFSVPGTHDTLTYDLSLIISEGGEDDSAVLSEILHLASELGIAPTNWIRNQSKTQAWNITQQLNYGVRFIDLRVMYTSGDWYSLHFVQSNHKAREYLHEIRKWLDDHPQEFLVIWVSKHGSACARGNDQYPDVPINIKQRFWQEILQIFSGVTISVKKNPINETSVFQLLSQNQRVVFYATDYAEFTGNSEYALDGCLVDNQLCDGIGSGLSSITCSVGNFENAAQIRKKDKTQSSFFLHSMATSVSSSILPYMFLIEYADIDDQYLREQCAKAYSGVPGITDWCPEHLLEISQLQNYYNQLVFERALKQNYDFPNAIYLDALDVDGTIRIGEKIYNNNLVRAHDDDRYSYAYTIILSNLITECGTNPSGVCSQWITKLSNLRSQYPFSRWDNPSIGRSSTWPFSP